MKSSILQDFKGTINGVEFNDRNIYYSVEYILEKVNEKFGETYGNTFIEDLKNTVGDMHFKYDDFSFSTLENSFARSVQEADRFEDIEFTYDGSDWKIESLNERIKNKSYENTLENLEKQIREIEYNAWYNSGNTKIELGNYEIDAIMYESSHEYFTTGISIKNMETGKYIYHDEKISNGSMERIWREEVLEKILNEVKLEREELTRDSDFDGLTDKEEREKYHTDPHTIDSDGDGINDYREVREDFTNPTEKVSRIDFRHKEQEQELEI